LKSHSSMGTKNNQRNEDSESDISGSNSDNSDHRDKSKKSSDGKQQGLFPENASTNNRTSPFDTKDIKLDLGKHGSTPKISNESSESSSSEAEVSKEKGDLTAGIQKMPTKGFPVIRTGRYLRRIEDAPKNPTNWLAFAVYLAKTGKDNDRAERYFRRAILVDHSNELAYSNYGFFLETVRGDFDRAEWMYRKSCEIILESSTKNAGCYSRYAVFLKCVRHNLTESEEFHKRAIAAGPQNSDILGNYGVFFLNENQDLKQAETYLHRAAMEAKTAPQLHWCRFYAQFLQNYKRNKSEARKWIRRASEMSNTVQTKV